jgi:hypothetical protein
MKPLSDDLSSIDRYARRVSAVSLRLIGTLLAGGLVLSFAGVRAASVVLLGAACLLLAVIPASSVVAALVDRVRERDWPFALAAAFIIGLIAYCVIRAM